MKKIACTLLLVATFVSIYFLCKNPTQLEEKVKKTFCRLFILATGVSAYFLYLGYVSPTANILWPSVFLVLSVVGIYNTLGDMFESAKKKLHALFFILSAMMACTFGEPITMGEIFRNAGLMALFALLAFLTREKPPAPIRFKDGIGVH